MSTGLILTIGSLIFLILLLITYFLQERPSLASNKLYRQLLIIVIILLLTEIMGSYLFEQSGGTTLYYVILRIHWSTGIFWFTALYFYSVCFLKDINKNSIIELIKTDKRCKIYSIYSIICLANKSLGVKPITAAASSWRLASFQRIDAKPSGESTE